MKKYDAMNLPLLHHIVDWDGLHSTSQLICTTRRNISNPKPDVYNDQNRNNTTILIVITRRQAQNIPCCRREEEI